MQHHSRLTSGAISAALLIALAACHFPYSLNGGGLDRSLRTVAVLPFENKTTTAGIERELAELLSNDMRHKMGLREAPESKAQVIVSGTITRYEPDIPVAFSADPSRAAGTRRRVELSVTVKISKADGTSLFGPRTMPATGEYAESAEGAGRREALEKLVNDIIRGVNSQW